MTLGSEENMCLFCQQGAAHNKTSLMSLRSLQQEQEETPLSSRHRLFSLLILETVSVAGQSLLAGECSDKNSVLEHMWDLIGFIYAIKLQWS